MACVNRVLIVGGGIGGLTLASSLMRRGVQAEIVEISADFAVQGIGIALQGPTLRALNTIGVIDRCLAVGWGIKSCDRHERKHGRSPYPPGSRTVDYKSA